MNSEANTSNEIYIKDLDILLYISVGRKMIIKYPIKPIITNINCLKK